jgi:hypothetical protein
MADTITIPSPRVFLTGSPIQSHLDSPPKPAPPQKPKQQRKRKDPASVKPKTAGEKLDESAAATGVDKKKQTKSRNGMYSHHETHVTPGQY